MRISIICQTGNGDPPPKTTTPPIPQRSVPPQELDKTDKPAEPK